MSTKISMTTARLDDAAGMANFLAPIPNGEQLAKVLQGNTGDRTISRAYDDETWTARFVGSDGIVVKCFIVTDLTIDQAEMIAAACPSILELSPVEFRRTVELALGPTFDPAE